MAYNPNPIWGSYGLFRWWLPMIWREHARQRKNFANGQRQAGGTPLSGIFDTCYLRNYDETGMPIHYQAIPIVHAWVTVLLTPVDVAMRLGWALFKVRQSFAK